MLSVLSLVLRVRSQVSHQKCLYRDRYSSRSLLSTFLLRIDRSLPNFSISFFFPAIYGCNFCTGGKKAFQALSSNILRVAAINSVGDFVLFLGKVLVVVLTVITGIYLIQVHILPFVPFTPFSKILSLTYLFA